MGRARIWLGLPLLAVPSLLAACSGFDADEERVGQASEHIAGGYDDNGAPAVVGLATLAHGGQLFRPCSGTLIADTLVLTAQHCIAETATFVDCASSSFGPPLPAEHVRVSTAPSIWKSAIVWHTA